MIKVQGLTKYYRDLVAVDHLSFEVPKGEILGFLGPNGAGKSTTMKMITGFLAPSAGSVHINGLDVFDNPIQVKGQIGYLPETPPLYLDMTARVYLRHVAELKSLPYGKVNAELERVAERTGITHVLDRLLGNLSKGYRQRVGLAQALLGSPAVLILDEPSSGLDPAQIREIRDTIRDLAQDHTVVLSTHILPEVTMLCNRVIIIDRGRIVKDGKIEELTGEGRTSDLLRLRISKANEATETVLDELDPVESFDVTEDGLAYDIQLKKADEAFPPKLLGALLKKNVEVLSLQPVVPSLEDIFLKTISEDSSAQEE
ncbi:MAG: ABC transporter ATP-binding protein [Myxococcales bacterium]|nr:ABC transporter ATP-binding protein [Myxococcales bacterium]MCB9641961.1 ABC transporter ATP-binding protein [Myxococcales bacterium]